MRESDWQLVYHAASEFEAALMVGLLQTHGIEAWYQGQLLLGALGELPPTDVAVGLWVSPRHHQQALTILEQTRTSTGSEWQCGCGEINAPEFELCWACGKEQNETN
ncbi:MAG: DUF2007 domain-containing protein [Alkalimonas sp.]|uniref:DUF2007 domain-containing protein n=1 Tax=Alkalimonas delamerensis TaxID=265981 RepID=A0ABT9GLE8_9GAMM|nr:DUF2007 domain-containing protein [Alkalimonas delamerensis]MCC5852494.1 DUF2007 domain-containing protein [Alkalimonas sp.]MDP4527759.1 DUF2007 domain-containing protein [Alkalimonas delamerensis]